MYSIIIILYIKCTSVILYYNIKLLLLLSEPLCMKGKQTTTSETGSMTACYVRT